MDELDMRASVHREHERTQIQSILSGGGFPRASGAPLSGAFPLSGEAGAPIRCEEEVSMTMQTHQPRLATPR